jgi:GNAT superfamily N-acetyltransferase
MQLKHLKTTDEIATSFEVFLELRPALSSMQNFIAQVADQQKEGYEMIAVLEEEEVVACIGFRRMTTLAWGKILYIDDLITREKYRKKGYGKILLDHVIQIGREHACDQVHLDTGHARYAAHRLYLKQGFEFRSHHAALHLK